MVKILPFLDLLPSQKRQIDHEHATGHVTELVEQTRIAVALDGSSEPDVVVAGSGKLWVGAAVRCLRDSTGRITRVEALPVEALPSKDIEISDFDATTQIQSASLAELADAQAELDQAQADLGTRVGEADQKASDAIQAATDALIGAANAVTVANLADAAAKGMVKASQEDPGQQEGRIWLQQDAAGRTVGIKTSDGTAWTSTVLMAEQVLVPGSVGNVAIGDGAVDARTITASEELWAKVATFAKVTTQMLVAGSARITSELLVDTLIGKVIRGGVLSAGANTATTPGYAWAGPESDNPDATSSSRFGFFTRAWNADERMMGSAALFAGEGSARLKIAASYNEAPSSHYSSEILPGRMLLEERDAGSLEIGATGFWAEELFSLEGSSGNAAWVDVARAARPPVGQAARAAGISIGSGAWMTIPGFETTPIPPANGMVLAGREFVVPVGGLFEVSGGGQFSINNAGRRGIAYSVNGTARGRQAVIAALPSNSTPVNGPTEVFRLAKGDRVSLLAFQDSGTSLTISDLRLTVKYVGA